ncbi:MAG: CRISPR-associated endonuclease Cas1 [Candidatus Marinimicrobia bacterium]|nr:CRISPR-associated endonuclease Cas1 [Candidatus Neomarinimicrobiota bacterium]MDD5583229.1 CRISPR-associated endonuclease Cas1 [Candidatus Neomarinimicrobiota bacterium]
MHLIINTFGTALRKDGDMIEISRKENKQRIPIKKISSIVIGTGVQISTDIVEAALKNNIDIIFLDKYGNPYGRFWHARMGSTARIRRYQLELSNHKDGIPFALQWILRKLENQMCFLEEMVKRRTQLFTQIHQSLDGLKKHHDQLKKMNGELNELRGRIFGIEGNAGRVWWDIYCQFFPSSYQFKERSRQPAKDEVNALLNYGYGILYGQVEKAIILAGLDPYIGFIHTDNYAKVSLVFDVIEQYRIWVEQSVLTLFSKRLIKKDFFQKLANGVALNDEGKQVFIPHLFDYLETSVRYHGREVCRKDQIQLDMYAFAKDILTWGTNNLERCHEKK